LRGWMRKTQNRVDTGEIKPHNWKVANCAEPNSLNNGSSGQPQNLEGNVVYTFETRGVKVNPGSVEKEPRLFYKKPCRYCKTLESEGVEMPQYQNRRTSSSIKSKGTLDS
jgi:hypothetical protein